MYVNVEAEILKERNYSFLRNAKRLFKDGEYDLAAFNVEQFCQLMLKYKLLVKTGTYPRAQSIVRLLRELDRLAPEKMLSSFIDAEIMYLTRIEDAYIVSLYLPRKYERKEVKALIAFTEKFREAVENV